MDRTTPEYCYAEFLQLKSFQKLPDDRLETVELSISAGITPVQVRTPVLTPESINVREPASLEDLRALIRGINPKIEGHIMKLAFTLCKKMVEIIF